MKRTVVASALLLGSSLATGGSAQAHDPQDRERTEPHTHWWLEWSRPELSWYAGTSVGQNSFEDWAFLPLFDDGSYTASAEDRQATGFRIFGALELGRLAVELGYSDLGETTYRAQSDGSGAFWAAGPIRETMEAVAFDLSLVWRLPVGQAWAVPVRLGAVAYDADKHASGTTQSAGPFSGTESASGVELLYGAGIEYRGHDRWRYLLTYQRMALDEAFSAGAPTIDVDSLSLSVVYDW